MNRRDFFRSVTGLSAAGLAAYALRSKAGAALLKAEDAFTAQNGAQVKLKPTTEKFYRIINEIKKNKWQDLEIGLLMGKIGKMFAGTPYVGGTLDAGNPEKCTVNLEGLDCVTFFENTLDIARIVKKNKFSFEDLLNEVTYTRYRGGRLTDYTSRLHYTADWFYDNDKKKVVDDISKSLGGKKFPYKVGFMSKNSKYYKSLVQDKAMIEVIKDYESKINAREYYYIPNDKVPSIVDRLKTGDIIAFACKKKGLDYSHTGLVYVDESKTARLLHASSTNKAVMLDCPIVEYVGKISTNIGISIARPLPV